MTKTNLLTAAQAYKLAIAATPEAVTDLLVQDWLLHLDHQIRRQAIQGQYSHKSTVTHLDPALLDSLVAALHKKKYQAVVTRKAVPTTTYPRWHWYEKLWLLLRNKPLTQEVMYNVVNLEISW